MLINEKLHAPHGRSLMRQPTRKTSPQNPRPWLGPALIINPDSKPNLTIGAG